MRKTFIINLVSNEPFIQKNHQVVQLVQQILGIIKQQRPEVLEQQMVWTMPHLPFPFEVKYNEDAIAFVDDYIANEKADLYGIQDWNIVRKGRKGIEPFMNIRIQCAHLWQTHEYKYSVSMKFHHEIARLLLAEHLADYIEKIAQTISADIGRIDYTDYYYGGGLTYTESMCIGPQREFPDDYDLTGLIPGVFWWTLLTERHLERLGGIDYVKRTAPCYEARDISIGQYQALALQLSPNPLTVEEEEYAALRLYLRPILPRVNPYALAFQLKRKVIPLSRICQLVTEDELKKAEPLTTLSFNELRDNARKSI